MGIGVIVSFIQIFQMGFFFLVPSALAALCSSYFFVCVYSLYEIFKSERERQKPNEPIVQYTNVVQYSQ
jgi:hypothetical protein